MKRIHSHANGAEPASDVRCEDGGLSSATHDTFPSHEEFTRPRPHLYRLCQLQWTCSAWPDIGKGVWLIEGYEDMGKREERFLLRRVMPEEPGGASGERIKVYRFTYEHGGLVVWRKGSDLPDPAYGAAVELRGHDAITDSGGRSHDAEGTFASSERNEKDGAA